eukprot:TRINITY_DN18674_c0_g1_i1.p1 TRINITY_DN18674_c0_g1~~TRINITY_DN18674_c0_g1_i1.p1  ORF type:complete len:751 (+),score=98.11 TRINITY_DN18674_c0_g1_i1:329-2254(+)
MQNSPAIGGWWMPYLGPRPSDNKSYHSDCAWSAPDLALTGCNISRQTYDCTKRPWYVGYREPHMINWSSLYTTQDQGLLSTMVTSGIYDVYGEFRGVTGVVVALSHVGKILMRTKGHNAMYVDSIFVDAATNTMIASTQEEPVIVDGDVVSMEDYSPLAGDLYKIQDTLSFSKTVVASLNGVDHYIMKTCLVSGTLRWNGFVFVPVSTVLADVGVAIKVALISAGVILLVWVTAVFVVLSLVMNSLQGVARDLTSLASLNLKQTTRSSLSIFTEVRTLQISAENVKKNLSQVIPFLPEKTSTALVRSTENSPTNSLKNQDDIIPVVTDTEMAPVEQPVTRISALDSLAAGLAVKRLTVVSSSISCEAMLATAEASRDTANFIKLNVQWFSLLSSISSKCRGIVHAYSEDQVIITFMTKGAETGHEKRGVQFLHNMILNTKQNPALASLGMTSGCVTGAGCIGNLGGVNIRTHAIVGSLCHEARLLSMLCPSRQCNAIVSKETATSSLEEAPLRAIDRVVMPNGTIPTLVFDLTPITTTNLAVSHTLYCEAIYMTYYRLWEHVDANQPLDDIRSLVADDISKAFPPVLALLTRLQMKEAASQKISSYKVALSMAPTVDRSGNELGMKFKGRSQNKSPMPRPR